MGGFNLLFDRVLRKTIGVFIGSKAMEQVISRDYKPQSTASGFAFLYEESLGNTRSF